MIGDEFGESGLPVWGQSHDLVLATVDAKAGVIGERAVKEAEGMGKADFAQQFNGVSLSMAEGGGRPFSRAVDGQDGGVVERGGEKRAGGMRFMMVREKNGASIAMKELADFARQMELASQPLWDRTE